MENVGNFTQKVIPQICDAKIGLWEGINTYST